MVAALTGEPAWNPRPRRRRPRGQAHRGPCRYVRAQVLDALAMEPIIRERSMAALKLVSGFLEGTLSGIEAARGVDCGNPLLAIGDPPRPAMATTGHSAFCRGDCRCTMNSSTPRTRPTQKYGRRWPTSHVLAHC